MGRRLLSILGLFILLASCEEETPGPKLNIRTGKGVYIINEGNLSYGNSSLSFYDPDSARVRNDVFYDVNAFPLGDAFQSVNIMDSVAYLCISNSGKIVMIHSRTFRHIKTITELGSPRYFFPVNSEKAYVSDLYNPFLTILDPKTGAQTGTVYLGKSSEMIVTDGRLVFINSWSYNDKIYVVDPSSDQLVDSIPVTRQPNSMVFDKNNHLWVLSDGGYYGSPYGQVKAALCRIDTESLTVEEVMEFSSMEESPSRLTVNPAGDSLLFLGGGWVSGEEDRQGVFKMSIYDHNLPENPVTPGNKRLFYGLGIDPSTGEIYCSDALDFMRKGRVYRYSPSGAAIDSFLTGIAPGGFYFH